MDPIRKSAGVVAVIALGFGGISGQVAAKTPDGETPAIEIVCNEYKDDIPGLFGLCNAICEAQDLDEFDKDPTSEVLNRNFMKKGGGYLSCGGGGEE